MDGGPIFLSKPRVQSVRAKHQGALVEYGGRSMRVYSFVRTVCARDCFLEPRYTFIRTDASQVVRRLDNNTRRPTQLACPQLPPDNSPTCHAGRVILLVKILSLEEARRNRDSRRAEEGQAHHRNTRGRGSSMRKYENKGSFWESEQVGHRQPLAQRDPGAQRGEKKIT